MTLPDGYSPAPPLVEERIYEQGYSVQLPIVASGIVYVADPTCRVRAVLEGTGTEAWRYRTRGFAKLMHPSGLVLGRLTGGIEIADPTTGRTLHRLEGSAIRMVGCDEWVVGHSFREGTDLLWGAKLPQGRPRWQRRLKPELSIVAELTEIGGRVVYGTRDGDVVALETTTGKEVWRTSVADLDRPAGYPGRKPDPGSLDGRPVRLGSTIIACVNNRYVVGLAAGSGRRRWTWSPGYGVNEGQLCDGLYHVLAGGGQYFRLDPENGRQLVHRDLSAKLPGKLRGTGLASPMLVSHTHLFAGSYGNGIFAFETGSGRYAWRYCPKGVGITNMSGARFVVGERRLYYADDSWRIYCLRQEDAPRRGRPTGPKRAVGGVGRRRSVLRNGRRHK